MSDSMAKSMPSPRSTRDAALERRRALSQSGAAALQGGKRSPSAPAATTNGSGKSRSRAHREGLSQGVSRSSYSDTESKVAFSPTQTADVSEPENLVAVETPVALKDGEGKDNVATDSQEQAPEPKDSSVNDAPTRSTTLTTSAVRQLGRERRNALSRQGKVAIVASSNRRNGQASPYKPLSDVVAGLSGREAARAHREALCRQGRGDELACRPSGRIRQKPIVPTKVEQGTTLSGTPVTGTLVDRSVVVTGTESGSCRVITGTEYIGSEQYELLCTSTPEPAPAKVGLGRTASGQSVTGTELGRSGKITGDEHGSCTIVTGTEYLSADKFESFCSTKPFQPPAKVRVTSTEAGQRVSGSEVGRDARVTGDEPGSNRHLTGSQYYQPEPLTGFRRNGSGVPHKVSVMKTVREQVMTGTETIPGGRVTGAERGACAPVTGTETTGLEQYQACNRRPTPGPGKVGVMHTWRDQSVSGSSVEYSPSVTGDEYGSCQPVTGTQYVGPDQYDELCSADLQVTSRVLMDGRIGGSGIATTGISLGPDNKVTGSSRGEGMVLSGTPYGGARQRSLPTGWSPTPPFDPEAGDDVPRETVATTGVIAKNGDFSVTSPARAARDSSLSRITGTSYGVTGRRITGPVNLAAGLVSGTPEFRYRDDTYGAAPTDSAPDVPRSRLTGDGREGGFVITGAAWGRSGSITGTEGASTRRNPTLRGGQRSGDSGTSLMKGRVRSEAPVIQVTGSSGSDGQGPSVTYSGGTRG